MGFRGITELFFSKSLLAFCFQFDEFKLNMSIKGGLICKKRQVYLLFLSLPTAHLPTLYSGMGFVLFRGKKAEFLTNASALTKGGLNPLLWRVLPPPTIFKDPLRMVQLMIQVRPTKVLLYFFFFFNVFLYFLAESGLSCSMQYLRCGSRA